MPWSDEARLLVRPFRAYAGLAAERDERPVATVAARVLFFLFVCGAFVSLITAGRLVAFHVASTMAFWAFIPAVQAGSFLLALRAAGAKPASRARALALYFAGHGAWMIFFMVLSGVCILAPDMRVVLFWLLRKGVLFGLLLGTIVWSMVLTYACFREGLALERPRAARGTAVFYAAFTTIIVGWYLANNEIQPQLPWAP